MSIKLRSKKKKQFADLPLWPVNAPGMPLIGEDFIAAAQAAGDTKTQVSFKGGKSRKIVSVKPGPILEDMLLDALYGRGELNIPITMKGAKKELQPIICGHRWNAEVALGSPGPEPCEVMILGKQLGEDEIAENRCFEGPSGKLVLSTCRKLAIRGFGKWYITNVVKTALGDSNALSAKMVDNFLHLLHQEIRLVKPKYILCYGADALKALFGKKMTLSKAEGQILELEINMAKSEDEKPKMHKILVMGCRHPASVLRDPAWAGQFERTMGRFRSMIEGTRWDGEEADLDHRVIRNEVELATVVDEVLRGKKNNIVAFDAEWNGDHPENDNAYLRTIQFSWAHKTAACIVLRAQGGAPAFQTRVRKRVGGKVVKTKKWTTDPEAARRVISKLVMQMMEHNRPCGHYFTSDLEWLVPYGIDLRSRFAPPKHYEDCREQGGLDTAYMAHAVHEVDDFSLTGQSLRYTNAPRYDVKLLEWKKRYCSERKIKEKNLEGYGDCPDEILIPYANYDADVTRRLAIVHAKSLDCDEYGNDCWEAFWVSQRAVLGVLEMKRTGIAVNMDRVDEITDTYMMATAELQNKIRSWANWPSLNLDSTQQVSELLFGVKYNTTKAKTGKERRLRPEGAKSLELQPVLTTDKRPRLWDDLDEDEEESSSPSTAKNVLGMLWHQDTHKARRKGQIVEIDAREQIGWLRDFRYIRHVLKSFLKPPSVDKNNQYLMHKGRRVYSAGLPSAICADGRVRTTIYQTKETGRWSSARPPLQNISKRREPDYKRILGEHYKYPLRSVLVASPGHVLVEADYIGAELFGMAIMSGDPALLDHAIRNQLPETDPNFYDIHSNVCVFAFRYDCPPTKAGLAAIGKAYMRNVAKAVIFGIAYGRGAKAISIAAREEGVYVTVEEAQAVIDAIFEMYPGLVPFFEECKSRAVNENSWGRYRSQHKPTEDAPGWLCGPFGRYRRFGKTSDRKTAGEMERQAQNFPIQGMIADAVSLAVGNLYDYRHLCRDRGITEEQLDYRLILQVHDAILFEVPARCVATMVDKVIPFNMVKRVPIFPCNLDGTPQEGLGPYFLGVDVEVMTSWGLHMLPDECEKLGMDPKYAGWRETEKGLVCPAHFPKKVWTADGLVAA